MASETRRNYYDPDTGLYYDSYGIASDAENQNPYATGKTIRQGLKVRYQRLLSEFVRREGRQPTAGERRQLQRDAESEQYSDDVFEDQYSEDSKEFKERQAGRFLADIYDNRPNLSNLAPEYERYGYIEEQADPNAMLGRTNTEASLGWQGDLEGIADAFGDIYSDQQGMSEGDRARMRLGGQQAAQQNQARLDAIRSRMASRGMAGGGAEAALIAGSNQAGIQGMADTNLGIQTGAMDRRMQALQGGAGALGQLSDQSYRVGGQQDAFDQFNADYVRTRNAGNVAAQRSQADRNTELQHKEEENTVDLAQQDYENRNEIRTKQAEQQQGWGFDSEKNKKLRAGEPGDIW